jgi:hypothetical protein
LRPPLLRSICSPRSTPVWVTPLGCDVARTRITLSPHNSDTPPQHHRLLLHHRRRRRPRRIPRAAPASPPRCNGHARCRAEADVQKGFVICDPERPCHASTTLLAQIALVELTEQRPIFSSGYDAIFHCHTAEEVKLQSRTLQLRIGHVLIGLRCHLPLPHCWGNTELCTLRQVGPSFYLAMAPSSTAHRRRGEHTLSIANVAVARHLK